MEANLFDAQQEKSETHRSKSYSSWSSFDETRPQDTIVWNKCRKGRGLTACQDLARYFVFCIYLLARLSLRARWRLTIPLLMFLKMEIASLSNQVLRQSCFRWEPMISQMRGNHELPVWHTLQGHAIDGKDLVTYVALIITLFIISVNCFSIVQYHCIIIQYKYKKWVSEKIPPINAEVRFATAVTACGSLIFFSYKGSCQKLLSGFCPLRGGGYPLNGQNPLSSFWQLH